MATLLAFDRALFTVRLGCYSEERLKPQEVELDLRIWFETTPAGCRSDRLKDVVCYEELTTAVENALADRSFHLIERLAAVVYDVLHPLVPADARLWIRVKKMRPPVAALQHGVSFWYGDPPPFPC